MTHIIIKKESSDIKISNTEAKMITNITSQELELFLAKEHPTWHAQSVHNRANEYLTSIDERLATAVKALVKSGERIDFQYGEFSLYLIQALCNNCSYWDAIILMDAYIKDPLNGKALILRR